MDGMQVNDYLKDAITKLDHTLLPPGIFEDVGCFRKVQSCLSSKIDRLGRASTVAQGLSKVITTAEKLRNSPDQVLYLLKDANANDGAGEVIGLLKVGHKRLFFWDQQGCSREAEPLCVLDFFILPEYQRHGNGAKLFDYMLQDTNKEPWMLAIDGPSDNMVQFMKGYGVEPLIRQVNNFAVSPRFFEASGSIVSLNENAASATRQIVGRYAAQKRETTIASIIHGENNNGNSRSEPGFGTSQFKIHE